jgi:hypothetical protein
MFITWLHNKPQGCGALHKKKKRGSDLFREYGKAYKYLFSTSGGNACIMKFEQLSTPCNSYHGRANL